MSSIICFNGQFLEKHDWNMGPENRSFLYGDGLFESIRFQNGTLNYIDDHLERLVSGMFTLGLDTTFFNPLQICDLMLELCKQNDLIDARIRLTVFREAGGYYKPSSDNTSYLITAEAINPLLINKNEKGVRLGLYSEIRKPINSLSGIKSSNGLLYVLAARYARENNWDDSIILNEHGRICESSNSNLFLVLPNKRILTPPISEGILPGVMRKNLIKWLRDNEYQVDEAIVLTDDFYRAEEVFLSNAIQGVRWVIAFKERRYFSTVSRNIMDAFANYLPFS
jgi:branched-chain amino acid aminotransferase